MTFQKKELDSEGKEKNPQQPIDPKEVSMENMMAKVIELTEKLNNLENKAVTKSGGITEEDVARIAGMFFQAQQKLKPQELDYSKGIREEDIPADDYDPIGVCFCCPLVGYLITDDRRKGHVVIPPYGIKEIFFIHASTKKIQSGKYQQLQSFSTYWSRSKKLTEWLRNHTYYNIYFYESSREAMGVDVSRALRLANIMKALQPLETHELFRRSQEYGLPITQDGPGMRANIAARMIEIEIERERESQKTMVEESEKSARLIGRVQ